MADYTIPQRRRPGIKALLELSETALCQFEEKARTLPRGLRPGEIADQLAAEGILAKSAAAEVVQVISDLYSIKGEEDADLDELVDGICAALKELDDESLKPSDGDWDKFKAHFKSLLSMDSTLGISFKASRLLTQNERTYVEANIFSDIRPAFPRDIESGFDTAVIIHNLQIEYHKDRTHEEIQIALDCDDIRNLKKLIDRAEKKEKAIRRQFREKITFFTVPKS